MLVLSALFVFLFVKQRNKAVGIAMIVDQHVADHGTQIGMRLNNVLAIGRQCEP